jgi:3-oxoacyl-[acyl-carrier protein] reductase
MTAQAHDTWALVTGASGGIGAATARRLAAQGRNIIVHYGRDEAGAEKTAAGCAEHGVATAIVQADLRGDLTALLGAIEEHPVDVLVNNAGITADGLAMSMSDEDFAAPFAVNVTPAFALCRAALRPMLRRRSGRIVNVSSVVGLHGNAGQANYAASKAALVGMAKSLAREVGKRGITVNAVAPGFIATAMTEVVDTSGVAAQVPAGRLGTPEEVAAVIAFLCSPEAAYVNGAVIQVGRRALRLVSRGCCHRAIAARTRLNDASSPSPSATASRAAGSGGTSGSRRSMSGRATSVATRTTGSATAR